MSLQLTLKYFNVSYLKKEYTYLTGFHSGSSNQPFCTKDGAEVDIGSTLQGYLDITNQKAEVSMNGPIKREFDDINGSPSEYIGQSRYLHQEQERNCQ